MSVSWIITRELSQNSGSIQHFTLCVYHQAAILFCGKSVKGHN